MMLFHNHCGMLGLCILTPVFRLLITILKYILIGLPELQVCQATFEARHQLFPVLCRRPGRLQGGR